MSPVILEVPEFLLLELERQAEREGVSVERYVLDTLTDLVTQRLAFEEMTTRYPQDQAEAALRRLLAVRELSAMRLPVGEPEEMERESVPKPEDLLP